MIKGLNDNKIRTEKGGYLFKAAMDEKYFYLGIKPAFLEGQRSYHYHIELPRKLEYFLTGSVNPEGIFSILFIPRSPELTGKEQYIYTNLYRAFAHNLLERGLEKPGHLDDVTPQLLLSLGEWNTQKIPRSLEEILCLGITPHS